MAKLTRVAGVLISVDTVQKTLKVSSGAYTIDFPYDFDMTDEEFFDLLGKQVRCDLSDGRVKRLIPT